MAEQKKWNKKFKQDAYTELMQLYAVFKLNKFQPMSFTEFSNRYFNEYLHEDWDTAEKRTFINTLLNRFPKIACRVNEKNQFRFNEHEYRVAKAKLTSGPEYIQNEIKNTKKSRNYTDVLNPAFLKKVIKLGKSEDTADNSLYEIWDSVIRLCYAKHGIKNERALELKEGESVRRYFYFNCLGDAVSDTLQRAFVYECGLLAGAASDKRYCREKLKLLLENELVESSYKKPFVFSLKEEFLEKVCLEEELEEIKQLLLSKEEKSGSNSALRVLLYAFLMNIKDKVDLDLSFIEEDFFVCLDGVKNEIAISGDRKKRAYIKCCGSLYDTIKEVFKQEEYSVISESLRYIKRLAYIVPYKDKVQNTIKILDYDEVSRGNIISESEQDLLANLVADFESSRAWDLLSKYYHAKQDYSMKSAINMAELLKFTKNETVQKLVYESFLRIMQHFDNQSRNANFLVNHLYLLKNTYRNESYEQYWKEFVGKLTKWNYIDSISTEDKEVLNRYIKFAAEETETATAKWCRKVGEIVYIIIKAYPEKITVLWEYYQPNCIFERFLFEEKEEQEMKNAYALLHVLILSCLRNASENSVLEGRIQNKIEDFIKKSNRDEFYPRKIRGVLGVLRDYRMASAVTDSRENKISVRLWNVQKKILEKFPEPVTNYDIRNLCIGTTEESFPVIQYCAAIYNENYTVQNSLYVILLKKLKAGVSEEFGMQLLELAMRQMELNNGTNYTMDVLRTLKTLIALNQLYYGYKDSSVNDRIDSIVDKYVGSNKELYQQLKDYISILKRLMDSSSMELDLKKNILCCGMTNYWDEFVEHFGDMMPEQSARKEEAGELFNEYLKQIDYCVFRRCVLQKLEKALEADLEQKESEEQAKKYIDAPMYSIKEGMPTRVLAEACRLIASVVKNASPKDAEIILDKLRWALDSDNKKWEMFERNIVGVHDSLKKIKENKNIIDILCAVTVSIYDYADLMSLNHRMVCNREKASFAVSFLNVFFQNEVLKNEVKEADIKYHLCIGYALIGNNFASKSETEIAGKFYKWAYGMQNEVLRLEGEHSADAIKLKTEILDKMERENFAIDETVMKKNSVIHEELFAFGFMVPEKESKLLKTLETEFKTAANPEEKCKVASRMYYWLLYSNEKCSYEYSDFVEEWTLAYIHTLTDTKSKTELLNQFVLAVEQGLLSEKPSYYQDLLGVMEDLLDTAKITIPLNHEVARLEFGSISVDSIDLESLFTLYMKLFRAACAERSGSVYEGVFSKLRKLNEKSEEDVREKIEQLSNVRNNSFAQNVLSALRKRAKGGFVFTVLNRKDDTSNALFYQIENISEKFVDKLYLVLKHNDIVIEVITILNLEKKDIFAGCFGELEYSYTEYSVHLYKTKDYTDYLLGVSGGSLIGSELKERGFCVFDTVSWEQADESSVAPINNVCVKLAFEEWKWQYGRGKNMVLRYNLKSIAEEFTDFVAEYCEEAETRTAFCVLDFSDKTFTLQDVLEKIGENEPKVVVWKNYRKALSHMTEEEWHGLYTNQECSKVRFVFCYYDIGSNETMPQNYVPKNMNRYVEEIFARETFMESLGREDLTRSGRTLVFLDQTLQCLERWSRGDVEKACLEKTKFLAAEWKHERKYVYPSDIVAFLNLKGVVNTTELMIQQSANEIAAENSVDTLVRVYPQLPEEKQKDVRKELVAAKVLPDNAFITVEGNLIKVDNANEVLLGHKFQQNIQNNIMNVFQTTIYEQGDLEKMQELNEELETLEREAEQWKDSCSALREELERNDEELAVAKKELAEKQKQLADATEATSAEREKLEEDVKAAELLIEELSNNSDLLKQEVEQKQKALDEALEDARNKGIDVEKKNTRIEELTNEIAELNVKFDKQETNWVQKIDEKVENELNGKFKGIRLTDMGHQLFPDLSADKFDILCMIMKKYNYEQKFYNAVFVHYIFNFLSGILGENNEAMDYSSVNLMYSKLYESILKDKHLQIYENKLPNEESPVVVYEEVNGQRVKRYKKFSELTVADDTRITIGTFAEALKNKSSRNGQRIWWNLNRLAEVGRDNLYESSAVSNVKWQLWDLHRQFIEKVTSIRNASLHGSRAGARITKAAMQELVDILFSGRMNTLTFVPNNGAFVQMFDVVSVQGVNANQRISGNRAELANFRRARQLAEEAEEAARLAAQASDGQTAE